MRILLIEDDQTMCDSLKAMFELEGIICNTTYMGEDGLEIGKFYEYDLIILDIMLPDINGYEVTRRLRNSNIKTPILIISGLSAAEDKIKGFGIGIDDYLTKPFDKQELMARIHAIVRRSQGHADSLIKTGRLKVNTQDRTASVDDEVVSLTPKEYAILELLSIRKNSTLTKEMFLNHLYGGLDEPELKIIDVFVCKLRRKLARHLGEEADQYIQTSWGRGYILRDPINDEVTIPNDELDTPATHTM